MMLNMYGKEKELTEGTKKEGECKREGKIRKEPNMERG